MDFFARQAATRRLSRWMVFLFVLAVLAIVVAIDLVVVVATAILTSPEETLLAPGAVGPSKFPAIVIGSSLVVLGTIAVSSVVRTVQLAAGGGKVAERLGGTLVNADTRDPLRRRLLNVVEEISIASGVPVPQVYVLDREPGINAFAAGWSPANAAIAVTRGALVHLNRDELQGVIAHEFSHVLNGDMRLSTRLIGLLFGLTVIAQLARLVLRHGPRSSGRKGAGGLAVIYVAALLVLVLGWIGLFFGRLIQAAVSRNRESLADASAVQFTRNPQGLRGALVKIGALGVGSRFTDADGEEVAHLVFAAGVDRAFATHPPIVERIRALDPAFRESEFDVVRRRMAEAEAQLEQELRPAPTSAARLRDLMKGAIVLAPEAVTGLVANPGMAHVLQAQAILASLPEPYLAAARDPGRARALFIALALDADREARERQLAFIHRQAGGDLHDQVRAMLALADALEPVQRLPALLQVFGALNQVPRAERMALLRTVNGLLAREGRVSVFGYVLRKLAQVQLEDDLDPRRRAAGHLAPAGARAELGVLFAVLASQGSDDEAAVRAAYAAGMEGLLPDPPAFARPAHWPPALDRALTRLDRLKPDGKERLVAALVRTIAHDGRMTVPESELLRAVCAALHCPLPPLYAAAS